MIIIGRNFEVLEEDIILKCLSHINAAYYLDSFNSLELLKIIQKHPNLIVFNHYRDGLDEAKCIRHVTQSFTELAETIGVYDNTDMIIGHVLLHMVTGKLSIALHLYKIEDVVLPENAKAYFRKKIINSLLDSL